MFVCFMTACHLTEKGLTTYENIFIQQRFDGSKPQKNSTKEIKLIFWPVIERAFLFTEDIKMLLMDQF